MYEYAVQRGSIHCHGVAKLQSDPNIYDLSQIALQGYLAAQSLAKDQLTHEMSLQKQQEVKEGCEAEKAICDYVDFLMSTQNPCNADDWFNLKFILVKHSLNILKEISGIKITKTC